MTGTGDVYFADMWTSDDPWDQAGRFSEHRKYRLTVDSLPNVRYRRAFEPGCATGILTGLLRDRCQSVVAMDRHPRAVALTRERFGEDECVDVRLGRVPTDVPEEDFDLIVYSELLYYLDADGVRAALQRASDVAVTGAHLVAVHYRPQVQEHELLGDEVHAILAADPRWRTFIRHTEPDFILDVCELT